MSQNLSNSISRTVDKALMKVSGKLDKSSGLSRTSRSGTLIEKTRDTKYISKKKVNGEWVYKYA